MEIKLPSKEFWSGKKVFITGHTGFKGSWLSLLLHQLGASVTGYSLNPPTSPNLFELCAIHQIVNSKISDIRDLNKLTECLKVTQPEIVIHMAAQALVRYSYSNPLETYEINVMGTVNILEAIRQIDSVKAVVIVTTDKCYENRELQRGYRENEPLGGFDPYSSSKACSELVSSAYRNSFYSTGTTNIATARAGNVIGGGDWAADRLIPDIFRAIIKNEIIRIRSPHAIRPWQHVLDPLCGYLVLAEALYIHGNKFAQAWNFGPDDYDAKTVEWIVNRICVKWNYGIGYQVESKDILHEANFLRLDCSKARTELHWKPKWQLEMALDCIVDFNKAFQAGSELRKICVNQIFSYLTS